MLCLVVALAVAGNGSNDSSTQTRDEHSLEQRLGTLYIAGGLEKLRSITVANCIIKITSSYERSCHRQNDRDQNDRNNVIGSDDTYELHELDLDQSFIGASATFPGADNINLSFTSRVASVQNRIQNDASTRFSRTIDNGAAPDGRADAISKFERERLDEDRVISRREAKSCGGGVITESFPMLGGFMVTAGDGASALSAIHQYADKYCAGGK